MEVKTRNRERFISSLDNEIGRIVYAELMRHGITMAAWSEREGFNQRTVSDIVGCKRLESGNLRGGRGAVAAAIKERLHEQFGVDFPEEP